MATVVGSMWKSFVKNAEGGKPVLTVGSAEGTGYGAPGDLLVTLREATSEEPVKQPISVADWRAFVADVEKYLALRDDLVKS